MYDSFQRCPAVLALLIASAIRHIARRLPSDISCSETPCVFLFLHTLSLSVLTSVETGLRASSRSGRRRSIIGRCWYIVDGLHLLHRRRLESSLSELSGRRWVPAAPVVSLAIILNQTQSLRSSHAKRRLHLQHARKRSKYWLTFACRVQDLEPAEEV